VEYVGVIGRRIERLYRQIGTGFAFVVFGVGGVVLSVTLFPLFNVVYSDRHRRSRIAQSTVRATWGLFVWMLVNMRLIDLETEGAELLRRETGTLVIANHPSLIDIVLLISLMERAQCVVKKGVWNNPFMRGVVKATNYIPNLGEPERTLRECVAALHAGNNLVIFPEGTRTKPGHQVRLERGFANIAIRAGAPIRIVTVRCDPPLLRKGEKWYKSPVRRPRFRVCVGERIETAEVLGSRLPARCARDLTAQITKRFEEVIAHESA
jgi:1-acyl-sn-glycerol-3-phosphate acyltransferase